MPMNSEYALDGTDLTEPNGRWYVMEGTSIPALGAPSNPSLSVPNRWGVVPRGATSWGTSLISIKIMVVDGNDHYPTGGGGRAVLDANWNLLMSRLHRPGLRRLSFRDPGWTWGRECRVRVKSISDPEITYGVSNLIIETTVVFENVDGVWVGTGDVVPLAVNALGGLDGGSAPLMRDLRIRYHTTTTGNIILTCQESGSWFTFRAPAGDHWTLATPEDYSAWDMGANFEDWNLPVASPGKVSTGLSAALSSSPGGFKIWPNEWGQYKLSIVGADPEQVTLYTKRAYA